VTAIPHDYAERVYAGVLGKLIGVYLGRPFEGWTYERILKELGPINYYVHDRHDVALRNHQLVVTDDDIAGTFAFPRALADNDYPQHLTAEQVGQAWLNYVVEEKSIFWWGGIGSSTEHTAFLRLKSGIPAPRSGSIELNGRTVAEQIGAQIFIDGWGMVAPGDPQLAADLAGRAASVSHDGEAIYGAQVIAAMEALAFVEPDLHHLLDRAVALIPPDSTIYRLIADLREWHATEADWRRMLDINLTGTYVVAHSCLPWLLREPTAIRPPRKPDPRFPKALRPLVGVQGAKPPGLTSPNYPPLRRRPQPGGDGQLVRMRLEGQAAPHGPEVDLMVQRQQPGILDQGQSRRRPPQRGARVAPALPQRLIDQRVEPRVGEAHGVDGAPAAGAVGGRQQRDEVGVRLAGAAPPAVQRGAEGPGRQAAEIDCGGHRLDPRAHPDPLPHLRHRLQDLVVVDDAVVRPGKRQPEAAAPARLGQQRPGARRVGGLGAEVRIGPHHVDRGRRIADADDDRNAAQHRARILSGREHARAFGADLDGIGVPGDTRESSQQGHAHLVRGDVRPHLDMQLAGARHRDKPELCELRARRPDAGCVLRMSLELDRIRRCADEQAARLRTAFGDRRDVAQVNGRTVALTDDAVAQVGRDRTSHGAERVRDRESEGGEPRRVDVDAKLGRALTARLDEPDPGDLGHLQRHTLGMRARNHVAPYQRTASTIERRRGHAPR